jgi:DNA polymerase-3 subunit gamma/tau
VEEQPTPQSRPSAPSTPPPAPAAAAPSPAEPGALDAAALRRIWPEVLEVVKQTSRRTRALLDNAQIVDVAGELVNLSAPPKLAKMIAEDSNTSVLRAALTKVVGGEWKIGVEGGAAVPPTAEAPAARPPAGTIPPPPEPDPRDDEDYEPASRGAAAPRVDPEAEAIKLLTTEFDARPLDTP